MEGDRGRIHIVYINFLVVVVVDVVFFFLFYKYYKLFIFKLSHSLTKSHLKS